MAVRAPGRAAPHLRSMPRTKLRLPTARRARGPHRRRSSAAAGGGGLRAAGQGAMAAPWPAQGALPRPAEAPRSLSRPGAGPRGGPWLPAGRASWPASPQPAAGGACRARGPQWRPRSPPDCLLPSAGCRPVPGRCTWGVLGAYPALVPAASPYLGSCGRSQREYPDSFAAGWSPYWYWPSPYCDRRCEVPLPSGVLAV